VGRHDKPVDPADDTPGARMRRARHDANISLTEMARKVGYSKNHLSGVETGKWTPPNELLARYEQELHLAGGTLLPQRIEQEEDPNRVYTVFLSGPTSAGLGVSVSQARRLAADTYLRIGRVCEALHLTLYTPSALLNPNEGNRVYANFDDDERRIKRCELLIAYLGIASTSVGVHLRMAAEASVPILLLAEAGRSDEVDNLDLWGAKIERPLVFRDSNDLEARLTLVLYRFFSLKNLKVVASRKQWTADERDEREQWLERQCKTLSESARAAAPIVPLPITVDEWEAWRPNLSAE
jgi:DNA-binding XRE family transcriptional regulator